MIILTLLLGAAGAPAPPRPAAEVVRVADVNDHGAVKTYRGVPLLSVVTGEGKGDELLIHCSDGFLSLLPRALAERWRPILASEVLQGTEWTALPKDRQPLYLVWPNLQFPAIDADRVLNPEGWAWAVTRVEQASSAGLLAVPTASGGQALEGRAIWIRTCFHCHAIDGTGGQVSWDLAAPTPVWSYLTRAQVEGYVVNPRAVNPEARMSPQNLSPRELAQLMAFMSAAIPPAAKPAPH